MTPCRQWDIVRFRIRREDRDLHPGVVISGEEWCASPHTANVNVLACSKRAPAMPFRSHEVALNGADGLEFQSLVDPRFFHVIGKENITSVIGRVSPERRRTIGRRINEVLRLVL
jgi:mRNA-degrading endonuclease toxin of MazEF toxin-antitoxin module